jgi:hypothetical protein
LVVAAKERNTVAAKIVAVTPDLIWPVEPLRLWFFPDASEWLRYSPHFHIIMPSGFRQNLPLTRMFVAVMEGKLSIKNYLGETYQRIEVRDQIWFVRGSDVRAQQAYAQIVPGKAAYERSGR